MEKKRKPNIAEKDKVFCVFTLLNEQDYKTELIYRAN